MLGSFLGYSLTDLFTAPSAPSDERRD